LAPSYARVSTTEQNLGLRHDDLKPEFDASVDQTDARSEMANRAHRPLVVMAGKIIRTKRIRADIPLVGRCAERMQPIFQKTARDITQRRRLQNASAVGDAAICGKSG